MSFERWSQQAFFGVSALLFATSAALTIVWCATMSAMGEMPMSGGWTMSMAWITHRCCQSLVFRNRQDFNLSTITSLSAVITE